MKNANPFITTSYLKEENFCGREYETNDAINSLKNNMNVALIAPRKMGKTCLIRHIFNVIKKENPHAICLYADVFTTTNLRSLTDLMAKTIFNDSIKITARLIKQLTKHFKVCRPIFTTDEQPGVPSVKLEYAEKDTAEALREILQYATETEDECYIAIDELQQLNEYPEKNIKKIFSSYIESLPNAHFIFAGSKQKPMTDLLPSTPQTKIIELGPIDKESYFQFANQYFIAAHHPLSEIFFDQLYDFVDGHTWYVQTLLKQLYTEMPSKINKDCLQQISTNVLHRIETFYQQTFSLLTYNQKMLLKAIAEEKSIKQINSSDFVNRYGFKNASSVSRAMQFLIENEFIFKRNRIYTLSDRFMALWLTK